MTEDEREECRRLALASLREVPLPETEGSARRWPRLWTRYAARPEWPAFIRRLEEAVNPHR